MISTLYGTLGAATGIAQGLFRGTFKPLPVGVCISMHSHKADLQTYFVAVQVPDAPHQAPGIDDHIPTELVADFAKTSIPAASVVHLLPLLVVGSCRWLHSLD